MAHPPVTIGIPTYNRSGSLRATLASVLGQTFENFRVVVRDNASSDDTADVVASFHDPRVDYVRSDRNIGLIGNFNGLIDLAETDFFLLLPDDDILYPPYLDRAVAALRRFDTAG